MDSHRDDLDARRAGRVLDALRAAGGRRGPGHAGLRPHGRRPRAGPVVDNPVVLPDGRVESTGNFHGAPLGFAADFLAIAAAEVGAHLPSAGSTGCSTSPAPATCRRSSPPTPGSTPG